MTYIKWKDEVESYLGNLPASEKQKIFSYFAEMYADKRDAGISEERIIEGFGAPYDVAQRILADSKENLSAQSAENGSGAVNGSGGNNYNYNYYNYNYGGNPSAYGTHADGDNGRLVREYVGVNNNDLDVSDIEMPLPEGTPKPKEKGGKSDSVALTVLLAIVLAIPAFALLCTAFGLIVGFFSAAIGCMVTGVATIGGAIGGLIAGAGKEQIGLMGSGFIEIGVGIIFLPLSFLIVKIMWKAIVWVFGKLKSLITA